MCGAGNYMASDECYKCMIGTYQSNTGQTSCTTCASPKSTTNGVGSTSASDCGRFLVLLDFWLSQNKQVGLEISRS